MKRKLGFVLLLVLVALWLAHLFSRDNGPSAAGPSTAAIDLSKAGSISGTIRGPTRAPAAGLTVMLAERRPGGGKIVAQTVTDAQGGLVFKGIPEGLYVLKGGSKAMGFVYMDVSVQAGQITDMGLITVVMPAMVAPVNPTSLPSQ
ncbi:MAG TPA: carboxypeptidase-like regulatory domain-containing protein [Tepidisphaeraceae bacterium]